MCFIVLLIVVRIENLVLYFNPLSSLHLVTNLLFKLISGMIVNFESNSIIKEEMIMKKMMVLPASVFCINSAQPKKEVRAT